MNIYLLIFFILVGTIVLFTLIMIALRTIAYCRLILDKYPPEEKK